MTYFLDSNIFLRFFAKEKGSKFLKECIELFKIIKQGKLKITTSHLVIAEVVWTLGSSYKADKEQVLAVVKTIETMVNLKIIDRFQTTVAHSLFEKHSIKYIDSLISSIPQISSKKMTVISYDKDFDKLGVLRIEPGELIK